jgi:hypothetical protein
MARSFVNAPANWPAACTSSSSPRTVPRGRGTARSTRAAHSPPPRWSLVPPIAPRSCWSHRRPCRSSSLRPPATDESCHPSAPALRNVPCALAVAGASAASVADSTVLLPTSRAAASRHSPETHVLRPSARPPASARNARPPARRTSSAPAPAPAAETSAHRHDSRCTRQCGVSNSQVPLRDSASTAAWPAGNSHAAAGSRRPPAVGCCASRQHFHPPQFLLTHLCPPQSDLLSEVYFRGTFLFWRKGDITIVAQQGAESFARLPGSGRSIGTIQQPKAGSYNLRLFRTILHRRKKLSAPRERLPAEYQLGRRASCGVCPLSVFRGACVCA